MGSRSISDHFPGFGRLFELDNPFLTRPFVAYFDLSIEQELPYLRAEKVPPGPLRAGWGMGGSTPLDVVWTTLALPMLVSPRIETLLRDEAFTGWGTIPCELFGKKGESWPYYLLTVHGRCGPIDEGKSVKIMKAFPAGEFPVWKGLYFDPATWDGSDFFMPAGKVGWVFVTERVKRAFERAKIRNVSFRALEDVEQHLPDR